MQIAGEGSVSDEEKIRVVSELIAYAHQVFYPTLFRFYMECIDTLKTSTAVKHLRQQYLEERGFAVHELDVDRPIRVRIPAFWEKLNRWMTI